MYLPGPKLRTSSNADAQLRDRLAILETNSFLAVENEAQSAGLELDLQKLAALSCSDLGQLRAELGVDPFSGHPVQCLPYNKKGGLLGPPHNR